MRFRTRGFPFGGLCGFGGAIRLTAFVNRPQPSGTVSIFSGFSFLGGFAMTDPVMGTYPVRRRLPTKYSTEIGRIITRFAFLESQLRAMTYKLLMISDKQGRLAIREPRVVDHVTMIQDLAVLAKLDLKVNWKKLKEYCKEAESFRNRLAHGIWLKRSDTKFPVLQDFSSAYTQGGPDIPKKPRIHPLAVPVRLEQLHHIANALEKLSDTILKIERRINSAMQKAWQRKRP